MLHEATPNQEDAFFRTRKLDEESITESNIRALAKIVDSQAGGASCPRCGGDLYYVERGASYAIWCVNPECKMNSVARGI